MPTRNLSNDQSQIMKCLIKTYTPEEIEVLWACDAKRGSLTYRKEGDGNESTWEEEARKA